MSDNTDRGTAVPNLDYSIPFDVYRPSENKDLRDLVNTVTNTALAANSYERRRNIERLEHHINSVVFNCCYAYKKDKDLYVGVPLGSAAYLKGSRMEKLRFDKRPMVKAVNLLVNIGFITLDIGNFDRVRRKGRNTRIKATERLSRLIEAADISDLMFEPVEDENIMLMRDDDDNKVPIIECEDTKEMADRLVQINNFIRGFCVNLYLSDQGYEEFRVNIKNKNSSKRDKKKYRTLPDMRRVSLSRVFCNDSLEDGGRFYSAWYQNVPRQYRQLIHINDEPTVEIDYSWLHPMLLYYLNGETLTEDPYMLDGLNKAQRDIAKIALNIMINAKDDEKSKNGSKTLRTIIDKVEYKELPAPYNTPKSLVAAYKQKHKAIEEHFASGIGVKLQYRDSIVAEQVMLILMDQGIPCLPVHDSFIVPRSKQQQLEMAMTTAFKEEFEQIQPRFKVVEQNFYSHEVSRQGATYNRYTEYQNHFSSGIEPYFQAESPIKRKAAKKPLTEKQKLKKRIKAARKKNT